MSPCSSAPRGRTTASRTGASRLGPPGAAVAPPPPAGLGGARACRSIVLALAALVTQVPAAGCREEHRAPARPTSTPTTAATRLTVLCAGDSITAASYPSHLQELLDRAGHDLLVVNAGRGGNTSGEYLAHISRPGLLERMNPSWVLLQLGTNDVRTDGDSTPVERFRENMEAILDLLERHRGPGGAPPRVLIATIPPVPIEVPWHFDAASRARVDREINPAIREIAAKRGIPVVDNHALLSAHPEWLPGIHPSEDGYRALARSWFEALVPLLEPGTRGGGAP